MTQTAETLLLLMEQKVANNEPISATLWIESATRINMLAGDLDNQLAHLEAQMNTIEAELITQDMPAAKAKVLARSKVNYEQYLRLKAVLNRIKEFLSLSRRRASIQEL